MRATWTIYSLLLEQTCLLADESWSREHYSAVRPSVKHMNSAKDTNETVLTKNRNTVPNKTVWRLFNLQIAIIYHGFTVVTLTAPWFCGRNVGYIVFEHLY